MSADDATARWLDEQLDHALARGGELPPDLVDTELGEVVQLFAADAAALADARMADASGVRRRLLEQVADEDLAGSAGILGTLARSTGRGAGLGARGAGWSAGRAWRARKVVMVAGCILVLCTTLAYADTRTPAGRMVRTAARTLQIPVPAEPKPAARAERDADARAGTSREERGASGARQAEDGVAGDRIVDPDAPVEPGMEQPGEPVRDGLFDPGEQPLPPIGDRPHDGPGPRPGEPQPQPGGQLPPDGGATQPKPNPDGSIPPPPQQPTAPQPAPQPKPPAGQQPPPNGTAPAPVAPRPPATQPPPGQFQPGTQPLPPIGPAPQPAP